MSAIDIQQLHVNAVPTSYRSKHLVTQRCPANLMNDLFMSRKGLQRSIVIWIPLKWIKWVKLQIHIFIYIVSSKVPPPPLTLSQKSCPPPSPHFCFPSLNFKTLVSFFLWFPPLIYNNHVPPQPKIFNLYIAGLHRQASNTGNTKSCNSQEQKQLSRSKLIFKYTNKHVQFAIIYPTPASS